MSQPLGANESMSAGEAKCDQHMETFIKCIKASGGSVKIKHVSSGRIHSAAASSQTHPQLLSCSSSVDVTFSILKNLSNLPGGSSADGFTAIKMTALARPQFLVDTSSIITVRFQREGAPHTQTMPISLKLSFSVILTKWQRFFAFLASQQTKQSLGLLEQKLEVRQLQVMPCQSTDSSYGRLMWT